ncbi:Vps51/Vps67/Dor1-like family/Exocyst complex component Sec5 [Novymonas esmeraldas]|uniref:Vps51/Vps67/Dor1-like family/Exocyst complex component Sec5 n=1 Tax=Novymonas esmeraldas TaxID=1808958 RepID=A0AAW0F223_9TRYP
MSAQQQQQQSGGADERRQRLRDQMKAFYGDPNASTKRAASLTSTQGNPSVPPELDLDSEYFNVNRYTTDLLKRETLKGLVEADTELLRRVRRLDGELQELVYRNYARFISATDTIREMKDNVVEMDTKLRTLSLNVNAIDTISSQISQQLQVHRTHIEDTITANRMLKKVQFLSSLPMTMRRLIDKEEFSVGVKYWVAGDGFLSKHKSIASITHIQRSCRELAQELYSAIEQRMCSYPLDDPDAMDRIRGYVEDLRLLRATSLFATASTADQLPFEEAVLRTLMTSVTASFHANVATAQRSLKAALVLPDDLHTCDVQRREASLAQTNLREPLAQLKNACAMLAINSQRVHGLLDVEVGSGGHPATVLVAQTIQPVLLDVLDPIAQSLADFAVAHLDAIAMDGGSALRDPTTSAEALRTAATHLARLLKQLVTAMKTLGEIHIPSAGPGGHRAVHLYANKVHEVACGVVQQCCARMEVCAQQGPEPALLLESVPLPTSSTSVLSTLPAVDEARHRELAFVLSRLLFASLAQCIATALRTHLVGDDGVPVEMLTPLTTALERSAQQLQHRGIVLLGQSELRHVFDKAFSGSSRRAGAGAAAAATAASTTTGPTVPEALMLLLPEWSIVYDAVKALPPITAPSAAAATKAAGAAQPAQGRRRDNMGYGGSSTGTRSDHHHHHGGGSSVMGGGSSAHPHVGGGGGSGGGQLAVSYTRQAMSTLQMSVNHIFANTDTWLRTEPGAGPASAVMACAVRYLLQGIVDGVREEVSYNEAEFHQLQVSCTFILYALVSPAKGSAARQWRKEWTEDDMRDVQRLLDEACTCAYELYEAKVPLSGAVLDRVVEAAIRGGRAAMAAAMAAAPTTATTTATVTVVTPEMSGAFKSTAATGDSAATAAAAREVTTTPPPPPPPPTSSPITAVRVSAPPPAQPQRDAQRAGHDDPLRSPAATPPRVSTTTAAAPVPVARPAVAAPPPPPSVPAALPPPPPSGPPRAAQAPPPPPPPPPAATTTTAATTAATTATRVAAAAAAAAAPVSNAPPSPMRRSSYYSNDSHTERSARVADEEELPM